MPAKKHPDDMTPARLLLPVEEQYDLLLEVIEKKNGIVPHMELVWCKQSPDKKKTLTLKTPLIPSLVIRARYPYASMSGQQSKEALSQRITLKKILEQLENDIKALMTNSQGKLAEALKIARIQKIELHVTDTGKPNGKTQSDPDAKIICESFVKF